MPIINMGGDEESPEVARFERDAGSADDTKNVNRMDVNRVRSALALWTSGANFGEIAAQLQFRSPAEVRVAIERALSEMVDDGADRGKLRLKMSLTLERLLRGVMTKAIDPTHGEHLAAVRTATALIDRYSRLRGLDAATEINVNIPTNDEFQRFVALAAAAAGVSIPEEGDPFADEDIEDAEVIEDAEEEGPEADGRLA